LIPDPSPKGKRQIAQKEAIERVLNSSDGKLLLEYLGDLLLFDVGGFCENPYASAFREGRRSVLMNLLAVKDMDILKYVQKVKEIQVTRINEE
jgi:hypothetical protein